ncbi:MAG: hypothetical protein KKE62_07910 [Proteobacteria bacterium]|nr:hypothetical protein [Pseudomonadota bacterium]MBU1388418.1 hypothetical protein [Pseudomonadota bacterium]MBU1542758.1 hypothetical protein [Pseudomonadota bacterium]MBU2482155.1 hypothetical protein [Pseudomonadota bacterium]
MSFDYGSDDLGIKNPFKVEGWIYTVSGLIIAALGVVLMLKVKSVVASGTRIEAWFTLVGALILISSGLTAIARGLYKTMRFFVGRGIPTSLAKNVAKSEEHTTEPGIEYSSQILEQMIQGRKNMTFSEPVGWSNRLAHTLFPRLLFLPYAFRNISRQITSGLVHTFFALLCYGLATFSGVTGLFALDGTPVLSWLGLLLTGYIIFIWWKRREPLQFNFQRNVEKDTVLGLVFWIALAIALPFALLFIHQNITPLPEVGFNTIRFVILTAGLVIVLATLTGLLLYFRLKPIRPNTEVSEYRGNWQESIHPQEILIHFENIVMANRRYKEIPNRIYRGFKARLIEEGSDDKGHFNAEMIQETQPRFRPLPTSPAYTTLRIITTIVGRSLIVIAALLLFQTIGTLTFPQNAAAQQMLPVIINTAVLFAQAVILWIFGGIIAIYANGFWAEIQYESDMVYFQCQGTYTQSKVSTGASIYDSTRSENTIVRSSLTPWVLACRIISSSFTKSGPNNFAFPRLILEMHKSDQNLDTIIRELKEFIADRENIAGVDKNKDLEAASRIYQINEQSRKKPEQLSGQSSSKAYVPEIPQDITRNTQTEDDNDSI